MPSLTMKIRESRPTSVFQRELDIENKGTLKYTQNNQLRTQNQIEKRSVTRDVRM